MKLVRLVMKLTPYGVLALMTKVVAGSNIHDIVKLGSFVVASYIGTAIMFVVHAVLLAFTGVNPMKFFRKVWPVITFAFTSRSSAASIPLNVEAQTRRLACRNPSPASRRRSVPPSARTAVRASTRQCWR